MKIKSIVLSNFRAHEWLEFTPDPDGITVLRGSNGRGKSTIIEALTWCLYGADAKPGDVVKQSDLIRYGATIKKGADQCYVQAIVDFFGETYRITRRITNMKGSTSCELEVQKNDEWEYVAGDSPKDVDPMIRKIVRLTREEFLTAVHIQQSKVNTIVDKSSKDSRTRVMYGFIGVNGAVESIRLARENARELERAIKSSTVTESTVDGLVDELQSLDKQYDRLVEQGVALKSRVDDLGKQYESLNVESRELSSKFTTYHTLQRESSMVQDSIQEYENNLLEVKRERENLKKQFKTIEAVPYHLAKEKYDIIFGDYESLSSELSDVSRDLKRTLDGIHESKSHVANSDTVESVTSGIEELEEKLASYRVVYEDLRSLKSDMESQGNSLKKAISVLETGDACPTCLQTVESVGEAVKSLQASLDNCRVVYQDSNSKLKELASKEEDSKNELERLQSVLSHLKNISELEPLVDGLRAREAHLESNKAIKMTELETAQKMLNDAQGVEDLKTREKDLRSKEIKLAKTIDANNARVRDIEKTLHDLGTVDEKTVEKLQSKTDKVLQQYNNENEKLTSLRIEVKGVSVNRKQLAEKLEKAKHDLEKYRELLSSYEKAVATKNALEEYKQSLIDNAIPVVENYASELINGFTDGRFLKVDFDETFLPTVHRNDGMVFPVTMLSGGEKQLTAIALRLASSLLLTGGIDEPLLEFDEITTSLDPENTQRVLQVAKEKAQGQIIIIDHKNDEVDNVADKIIEI